MDSDIQNADRFLSAVQPSLDNKRNNMPDGMQDKLEYFPINLRVGGRAIAVCGATEDSLAKVRLLLKTAAQITVYHDGSDEDAAYHTFLGLADEQKIELVLGEPSDKNLAQAVMAVKMPLLARARALAFQQKRCYRRWTRFWMCILRGATALMSILSSFIGVLASARSNRPCIKMPRSA